MKRSTRLVNAALTGLALMTAGFGHFALAQDATPSEAARKPIEPKKPDYSPYPDQRFPIASSGAWPTSTPATRSTPGMFGITLTPDDLFKVATGGEVVMDNGQRFKQDRPLDWVSVTDHAEYLGIADQIRAGSPELLENPQGKRWYEMSRTSPQEGVKAAIEAVVSMQTGKPVFSSDKLTVPPGCMPPRQRRSGIGRAFSPRCTDSSGPPRPGGNNLHRTVIFATARTA